MVMLRILELLSSISCHNDHTHAILFAMEAGNGDIWGGPAETGDSNGADEQRLRQPIRCTGSNPHGNQQWP